MTPEDVKLTVRLPRHLHSAIRQRAGTSQQSLNQAIVTTLWRGLAATDDTPQSEHDEVASLLLSLGLWSPDDNLSPVPDPGAPADHAAFRRAVGPVPPLSEQVLDDRGPR